MDIKKIDNVSAKTEQAIQRKSAYALPDRPSESGMRADEIKKAFYSSITDKNDSVLSELKRVVNESNDIFEKMQNEMQEHADNNLSTIQFAENERQKSKNLLILKQQDYTIGVNVKINETTQELTLNGVGVGINESFIAWIEPFTLKAGKTYTISATQISGSRTGALSIMLYDTGKGLWTDTFGIDLAGITKQTITPDKDLFFNALRWYIDTSTNTSNYTIKLQVEENNQATEWQYPYGEIVHEKDVPLPLKAQMICRLNSNQTTTQTGSNPILFDNITTIGNSGLITFSNGNFIFDNSVKYLRVYGTVQVAEITDTVAVDFNIAGLHFAGMDTSPNAPNTTNIVINTPLIENTGSVAPRLYIPDNTGEIQYWYTILVVEAY